MKGLVFVTLSAYVIKTVQNTMNMWDDVPKAEAALYFGM